MATSPWYRGGTAKFTNGSTTVTGTDTEWVKFVRAGDGIQGPDGKLYQITNVSSSTSLSIFPAYGGVTSYWTIPIQGYVKQLADTAAQLVRDFEGGAVEAIDAADRAKQSAIDAETQKNEATAEANRAGVEAGRSEAEADRAEISAVSALNEANRSEAEADRAQQAANEAVSASQTSLFLQRQVFAKDIIIPTGHNALIIGDFTVQSGVTIEGQGTATLRGI